MLEHWFVQKYQLPPTHELFLGQPLGSHLRGFYEDQLDRKDEIEAKLKHGHLSAHERVHWLQTLKNLSELLEDVEEKATKPSDPLAAYWEAQIARGEMPDMDLTIADLKEMGLA